MIEKTYSTAQGNIHYWLNRFEQNRKNLIFLPGLTADHRLFDDQISYFDKDYNLLVWDAPGHYQSRPFQLKHTLMDKAIWLQEILRSEKIEKPILIGQSMGGYVSQCFMQQYPGEVRGFVSIDSAPIKREYMTLIEIMMMKWVEGLYKIYPWQALIRDGVKGCAYTEAGRKTMLRIMESYTKQEYAPLAGFGYKILADAILADLPYKIDCPALLLCGEHDKAGSTKRYNLKWAKKENLPLKLIPNAGHNANTDNPQRVNELIAEFITTL